MAEMLRFWLKMNLGCRKPKMTSGEFRRTDGISLPFNQSSSTLDEEICGIAKSK